MLRQLVTWNTGRCVASTSCGGMATTASSAVAEHVTVPKRIRRTPTSILDALSSTVGVDPTGSHYSYVDDTRMRPTAPRDYMVFALSKEAGRRVAKSLATEWPTLFMYDRDEPRLEAFRPHKTAAVDEVTSASLEDLHACIRGRLVAHSAQVYMNIRGAGNDVPIDTQHRLLQLLAYYNGADPQFPLDETGAFIWYRNTVTGAHHGAGPAKEWLDGGVVDVLWEEIRDKTVGDYACMIGALVQFKRHKRAYELYKQMIKQSLQPNESIYVSLIRCADDIVPKNVKFEQIWTKCTNLLSEMNKHRIKPTHLTFDALLSLLGRHISSTRACELIVPVVAEATAVGCLPSPAALTTVLRLHADTAHACDVLDQVLTSLEAVAPTPLPFGSGCAQMSSSDKLIGSAQFFIDALDIARKQHDWALGERVIQLAQSPHAAHLLVDSLTTQESLYESYLKMVCACAPDADTVCARLLWVVPSRALPASVLVVRAVLDTLFEQGAVVRLLPTIWPTLLTYYTDSRVLNLVHYFGLRLITQVQWAAEKGDNETDARQRLHDCVAHFCAFLKLPERQPLTVRRGEKKDERFTPHLCALIANAYASCGRADRATIWSYVMLIDARTKDDYGDKVTGQYSQQECMSDDLPQLCEHLLRDNSSNNDETFELCLHLCTLAHLYTDYHTVKTIANMIHARKQHELTPVQLGRLDAVVEAAVRGQPMGGEQQRGQRTSGSRQMRRPPPPSTGSAVGGRPQRFYRPPADSEAGKPTDR